MRRNFRARVREVGNVIRNPFQRKPKENKTKYFTTHYDVTPHRDAESRAAGKNY